MHLLYHTRIRLAGYLFILPLLVGFTIFVILPAVFAIWVSFRNWNGFQPIFDTVFTGLKNYNKLFKSKEFLNALSNTFQYVVGMVLGQSALGLGLALLLQNVKKGLGLLRGAFFLPSILSAVAMSLLWKSIMFAPDYGLINMLLKALGFPRQAFLGSMSQALTCIILMSIWKYAGHYMILFITGLKNIPNDYYDSARIDGANNWNLFTRITMPLLKPTILLVLVMNAIGSFQVFGPIVMMTEGGPGRATESIATLMYDTAFANGKFSYAISMAMVLFGIIMIVTFIQMYLMRNGGLKEY